MIRGLVDANILVYAANADEPKKHMQAKVFIQQVISQPADYVVSYQSLREFASVSIKKAHLSHEKIREYVTEFQYAFGDLIIDLPMDIASATTIVDAHKAPFWDSLLASTAFRHGIFTIYTENVKDFEKIPGIKPINPLK